MKQEMFNRTKLNFKTEIEFLQLKRGDREFSSVCFHFKIDFYMVIFALASDILSAFLGKQHKLRLGSNTVQS